MELDVKGPRVRGKSFVLRALSLLLRIVPMLRLNNFTRVSSAGNARDLSNRSTRKIHIYDRNINRECFVRLITEPIDKWAINREYSGESSSSCSSTSWRWMTPKESYKLKNQWIHSHERGYRQLLENWKWCIPKFVALLKIAHNRYLDKFSIASLYEYRFTRVWIDFLENELSYENTLRVTIYFYVRNRHVSDCATSLTLRIFIICTQPAFYSFLFCWNASKC